MKPSRSICISYQCFVQSLSDTSGSQHTTPCLHNGRSPQCHVNRTVRIKTREKGVCAKFKQVYTKYFIQGGDVFISTSRLQVLVDVNLILYVSELLIT